MSLFEQVLTKLGISVRVDDSPGWTSIARAGLGPADRNWPDMYRDLTEIVELWRDNFLIRQVVRLTTAYVVGDGITASSSHPWVAGWVEQFWDDPQNRIGERLGAWCDELTRSGELYIALFPNLISGMQYVRVIPASSIEQVICDEDDYEKEIGYLERIPGQLEPKKWKSHLTAKPEQPCLLHFAINKPVGATRGESDLTPVLAWAKRYSEWLTERTRFNRIRNELALMHIEVQDESKVEAKRRQYSATPPTGGSILVTGPGEKVEFPTANIQGYEAAPDGKALRLAFAAGANIPLHFMSEGSDSNRNTAAEMGDPTHRHYRMRQQQFVRLLRDLITIAYERSTFERSGRQPEDLRLEIVTPDVSRDDNRVFAQATAGMVSALVVMKQQGWVDDEMAIRIAYKFAGENITEEEIQMLLEAGPPPAARPEPEEEPAQDE